MGGIGVMVQDSERLAVTNKRLCYALETAAKALSSAGDSSTAAVCKSVSSQCMRLCAQALAQFLRLFAALPAGVAHLGEGSASQAALSFRTAQQLRERARRSTDIQIGAGIRISANMSRSFLKDPTPKHANGMS